MIFYTRDNEIKNNACKAIQELEGVWRVSITQPRRSLSQNDYMHVLFDEIAPHTGMSSEALKAWFKGKFLGVETVKWRGEGFPMARKTSELNKAECTLFIEQLLMLADEMKVPLKGKDHYGIS
jgi:hypothetical protein